MLKALTDDTRYEELIPILQREEKETGGISMCELLDKYENRGLERGRTEGIAQGKIETMLSAIRSLMNNMELAVERAMEILEVPAEERADYLSRL